MPGLTDAHVHICRSDGATSPDQHRYLPPSLLAAKALRATAGVLSYRGSDGPAWATPAAPTTDSARPSNDGISAGPRDASSRATTSPRRRSRRQAPARRSATTDRLLHRHDRLDRRRRGEVAQGRPRAAPARRADQINSSSMALGRRQWVASDELGHHHSSRSARCAPADRGSVRGRQVRPRPRVLGPRPCATPSRRACARSTPRQPHAARPPPRRSRTRARFLVPTMITYEMIYRERASGTRTSATTRSRRSTWPVSNPSGSDLASRGVLSDRLRLRSARQHDGPAGGRVRAERRR